MGGWHASDLDDVPILEGYHIMAYILHFLPALVGIMYSFLTNRYIVPKEGYPSLGLCLNTCIELTKNGESRLALPSSSWAAYTRVRLPASSWGAACPRCAAHVLVG